MILQREEYSEQGVFGTLRNENDEEICKTLEHAYLSKDGSFKPKLRSGNYLCVKGPHQLKGGSPVFTTFEVTGVFGHKGILFHPGNRNDDSAGCILLGEARDGNSIVQSRAAFNKFMHRLEFATEFMLVVV